MDKVKINIFGKELSIIPKAFVVDMREEKGKVTISHTCQDGSYYSSPIDTLKEYGKKPSEFIGEFYKIKEELCRK